MTNDNEFDGQEADQLAEQFAEAERRFEKGQYYRLLLRENFFENDTVEATEVINEIRGFIRERLAVLLGVQPEKPSASEFFSDEEVSVLKMLAAEISKRPKLMAVKTSPAVPEKQPPKLKKTGLNSPKLKKQPETEPEVESQPVQTPKQAPKRQVKGKRRVTRDDGSVIEIENGQTFLIETNDLGTEYRRNITQPVVAPDRKPIPPLTDAQMAMVAGQHDSEVQRSSPVARLVVPGIK